MMDLKVSGNIYPKKQDLLFASCDSEYFMEHAVPWSYSVYKAGMDGHIHVVNPTSNVDDLQLEIMARLNNHITFSSEITDLSAIDKRVYYSCNRFLLAPTISRFVNKMAITDIDCMVMKSFTIPDRDIGLYLRDPLPGTVGWEELGTHVAAGIVSFQGENGKKFMNGVKDTIMENAENPNIGWRWFIDQVALWAVFRKVVADNPDWTVWKYKSDWLDWEFKEGTKIWTGKGDRKTKDPVYVEMKQDVTKRYNTDAKTRYSF